MQNDLKLGRNRFKLHRKTGFAVMFLKSYSIEISFLITLFSLMIAINQSNIDNMVIMT